MTSKKSPDFCTIIILDDEEITAQYWKKPDNLQPSDAPFTAGHVYRTARNPGHIKFAGAQVNDISTR